MKNNSDPTRTLVPEPADPHTQTFEPALDAGLAAAFGPDPTPGGWSRPPLLRDDPSDNAPLVQPSSNELPRGGSDRYQLLGEIARGGMGVILKGRDPDLGRDLAFKVLKAELAGKPAAEQRFVEEAQVGGQLQHPGVIPVYDLGRFADGRPFFAMKLVKGRTLTDLLAERKSPSDDRGRQLQVFLQACQTVAYAHSRGVIHRDIKPSNVMVGAFGEVLVMDWGLAKVLPRGGVADEERATLASRERERAEPEPTVIHTARSCSGAGSDTLAGSVMGTPAFMPPEQAGGEIDKLDERADVFGLGAVLCVILTGEPPYVADTADATRLMAIRGDLEEAFARLDACGTDAELMELCKRCLSARRDTRPRHAGEVAEAVAEYLAGVEQRAHRAELERAETQAKAAEERKRHRVQLALAASLLGLAVLAGGGAWWMHDQRVKRDTELARQHDETQRVVAAALEDANQALDGGRWIDAAAAIARAEDRLGGGDEFPELRSGVRQARADREMALALERASSAEFDVSSEQKRSANEATHIAAYRAAFVAYGFPAWEMEADAIRERLKSSRIGRLLTEELVRLSRFLRKPGDLYFPRLMEMMQQIDDDPYRRKLSDARLTKDTAAVLKLAEDPALRVQSAATVIRVVWYLKDHDQPVSLGAFDNLRLARLAHPTDFVLHNELALLLCQKGRPEDSAEAMGYVQISVALRPQSGMAMGNLGYYLMRAGQVNGAVMAHRRAIELDPGYAYSHVCLGWLLKRTKDWAEAEAELREAIRLDPKLGYARVELGHLLYFNKDLAGAEAEFREAIRLDQKNAYGHDGLGQVLWDKKDKAAAEAGFREAIRLDPKYSLAHFHLGSALFNTKDLAGAEAELREAIRLDPKYSLSHANLGTVLWNKKDLPGAEAAYREAIRLNPTKSFVHHDLGRLLDNKDPKDPVGAEAAFREAIRLNPSAADSYRYLGNLLQRKPDRAGAEAAYREAIRLNPTDAIAHFGLGVVLRAKPDLAGAEAAYREAIRLNPTDAIAHFGLGVVLRAKPDPTGAEAAYREAIRVDPKYALPHNNLGNILLREKKDLPGAEREYREAIRLDPKYATPHVNLGDLLLAQKDSSGAEAEYREAIRIDPNWVAAYFNLGRLLQNKKDWEGAIAQYRAVIGIEPNNRGAVFQLGFVLGSAGRPAEALRVTTDALTKNPSWADNPRTFLRYNAGCFAMNCADGKGTDVPPPAERPAYRKQAFEYLTADLAATRKLIATDRPFVHKRMQDWLTDTDLTSVREQAALEKLPRDERVGWVKWWTEVRDLRDATAPLKEAPSPREVKR